MLPTIAVLFASTAAADVPQVAVDIAPVHSLVARVMDGVGTPDLILPPGASPHEYTLRPSEAAALQNADLVFWIGPDLTPWLADTIKTLASNAEVTDLLDANGTMTLKFRENALFEAHDHSDHAGHSDHDDHTHDDHAHAGDKADDHDHEGHDHAEDTHADNDHSEEGHAHEDHEHDHAHDDAHAAHAHGAFDPHAWLSPQNAVAWLNVIAAQLSAADPDNAGAYFANAAAARAETESLIASVSAILDPVRGGRFIVFHDAYQYFESAFDFPASGAISLSDASDPSPARIASIQTRITEQGIDCVLAEPQFNAGIVDTVMRGTDTNVGVLDPLGSNLDPGAGLYPALISNLATALAECM